jgi:hypothetical protein
MTRSELEHIIRASGAIADDNELIIIGSQSILAQFPEAPAALRASMETDLYPKNKPELADLVDGSIGEGSFFHEQFGYYAQGVGPKTAVLPAGWKNRLVRIDNENTNGVAGLCLDVHDLAISKYIACRPKDLKFTRELARQGMTERKILRQRLERTKLSPASRNRILSAIDADFQQARGRKR